MKAKIEDCKLLCDTCGKFLTTPFSLIVHLREHTEGVAFFVCKFCKKVFRRKLCWKKHEQTHREDVVPVNERSHKVVRKEEKSVEKLFRCEFCSAAFRRSVQLTRHERIHTENGKFECQLCGKRFQFGSCLDRHMESHTGTKSFKCKFCEKCYIRHDSLRKHFNAVHTAEGGAGRKNTCDICDRAFFEVSSLKRHMRIHTGETEATCHICQRDFTRSSSLTRHMHRKHILGLERKQSLSHFWVSEVKKDAANMLSCDVIEDSVGNAS